MQSPTHLSVPQGSCNGHTASTARKHISYSESERMNGRSLGTLQHAWILLSSHVQHTQQLAKGGRADSQRLSHCQRLQSCRGTPDGVYVMQNTLPHVPEHREKNRPEICASTCRTGTACIACTATPAHGSVRAPSLSPAAATNASDNHPLKTCARGTPHSAPSTAPFRPPGSSCLPAGAEASQLRQRPCCPCWPSGCRPCPWGWCQRPLPSEPPRPWHGRSSAPQPGVR